MRTPQLAGFVFSLEIVHIRLVAQRI
jgi:hypothetical protein